ncbi:MAG: autotransporter outer membrane beta-barrel domain-containing protein [Phenylobacterium sp.]|uniref:autotransporter outer membrane beta-barrel domain-containing protein n=1 Tax=Phenylobacterium sp. TaxID=1871053 RepID=UPI00272F526C|nr:autotransporter outer membrane beta-barrel domain-containing protein [Phenylobacterium sp.]MDP2011926.1 autotransporter outer membrane beta-barrel domain-containing protein [Phenylobacterium sp.]
MRFLAAAFAAFLLALGFGAGSASAQAGSTITLPDGTTIVTTIAGLNNITISISGGPYAANPATVKFTSVVPSATSISYTGTIATGGTTESFNCVVNTVTQAVTGSGACAVAFGQAPTTTPTTPTPPTPPPRTPPPTPTTSPTTPTTPTTPITSTTPGTTTVVTPNGTIITVTLPEKALITQAEADQLFLALVGTRVNATSMQNFVAQRLQGLSLAGLTSSLGPQTRNGRVYKGLNAGAFEPQTGLWVNASGSYVDDSRPGSAQDGWGGSAAIGGDVIFDSTVLGAYVGYGSMQLDGTAVDYQTKGWTVGGYASWSAGPAFQITGTVGYSNDEVEYGRTAGALRTFGETDRNQLFGSVSIGTTVDLGADWVLTPSLGGIASTSDTDAYLDNAGRPITGASVDLTIAQAGTALIYTGSNWLPYVSASFNSQTDGPAGVDKEYGYIGAGFAAPLSDDLALAFNIQTLVGKKNEGETSFGFTLRRAF